MEIPPPRQLIKKTFNLRDCGSRGSEFMAIMAGSMAGGRRGAGTVARSLYLTYKVRHIDRGTDMDR